MTGTAPLVASPAGTPAAGSLRVALLTNSLSPHSLPLWECLSSYVAHFRVFVSADYDRQHKFPKARTHLDVRLQRSFNRLRFYKWWYGSLYSDDFHLPYDTFQQLRAYAPNLIVSAQLGPRTALSVLYRLTHPGVKLILWATLSERSERSRGMVRRQLRRWILRNTDGAFVNGSSGEAYLRTLGYRGPVSTIPYSIDDRPFRNDVYNPAPERIRLLFTGRLVPQKGLRAFCAELDRWCGDHPARIVSLRFVGEGREDAYLRGLQTHTNLSIEVLPKVPQAALSEYFRQADIYAFPTLSDEWGVSVNEAMIAGLPVLGSIHGQSTLELVEDDITGWSFDLLSRESTYAAIDRALSAPVAQLHAMSHAAKQRIATLAPARLAERAFALIQSIQPVPPVPAPPEGIKP